VLREQGLQLRIGARTCGSVPLEAIAACERLAAPPDAWLRRHSVERGELFCIFLYIDNPKDLVRTLSMH
jgi:hypothetical protein